MSILDKVIAAVHPEESQAQRTEARAKAQSAADSGDWLSLALSHHVQLETAFAAVKTALEPSTRIAAQKRLAIVLTGHAIAEESVLYPALAEAHEKGHADTGYSEQAIVKMEMAELEKIPPMNQAYLDKLEHIRRAVAHHMYEEEGTWFLELKHKAPAADQAKITQRYKEEFDRYVGSNVSVASGGRPASPV